MKKKILVALLSLSLIVTMMPLSIFASNSIEANSQAEVAKEAKQDNKNLQGATYHKVIKGQSDHITYKEELKPQGTVGERYALPIVDDDAGYGFDRWHVIKASGGEVSVEFDITVARYVFTMPDCDVTVIPALKAYKATAASAEGVKITPPSGEKVAPGETAIYKTDVIAGVTIPDGHVEVKNVTTGETTDIPVTISKDLKFFSFTMPMFDVEAVVTPVVEYYYVLFHLNYSGAIDPYVVQPVEPGKKAEKPVNPTREGYLFSGWYESEDCTGKAFDFDNTEIKKLTHLYAKWIEAYKLNDKAKLGKTTATVEGSRVTQARAGDEVTLSYSSTQKYMADGWQVKKTATGDSVEVKDNKFIMPAEAVDIYPNEVPLKYNIQITNADHTMNTAAFSDAAKTMSITQATEGETVYINSTAKSGFNIIGYRVETLNGKKPIVVSEDGSFTMPDEAVNVWAIVDHYNISASQPKHCTIQNLPSTGKPGESITFEVIPEDGWKVKEIQYIHSGKMGKVNLELGENGLLNAYTFTMPEYDLQVVPVMEEEVFYKIETVNPDHGRIIASIDGEEASEATEGTLVHLRALMGAGWHANGFTVMKGKEPVEVSADNDFVMPDGNVKIYVKESQVDYQIKIIDIEHGKIQASVDGKTTTTAHYGDRVKLTATTEEGWKVSQFLVKYGKKYLKLDEDNQFKMPYGNVVVFAQMVRKKVTVSFDSMGGTPVESQKIVFGSTAKEPAAPTRDGYRFTGWYLDKKGEGTPFDFSTSIKGDTTLYAGWVKAERPGPPLPHPPRPTPIPEDVTPVEQVTAMATAQKANKEVATGDSDMIILYAGLGAVAIGTALVIGLRRRNYK